jgi:hypothetical protein
MRRLRVTIIDVVSMGGNRRGIGKLMNANLASLMPQVVAAWCEELGHRVRFVCYTAAGDLDREMLQETDILFVSAFTRAAQIAYAISNLARRHGAVTVLGGPHARCYPEDASQYFDYVLGLTDKATIANAKKAGIPVVVVLFSGRPLILDEALTEADAFVAAWLPGTEGLGVADVLFGDYKPTGKLPVSWPRSMAQVPLNVGDASYDPLFPFGFGLTF